MMSIAKFIGAGFRSRYVNPTWIEGMQKEGDAGAGEMRQFVDRAHRRGQGNVETGIGNAGYRRDARRHADARRSCDMG